MFVSVCTYAWEEGNGFHATLYVRVNKYMCMCTYAWGERNWLLSTLFIISVNVCVCVHVHG